MASFIARLPQGLDQAMTLFQLRRIGASGEYAVAPNAKDMHLIGSVPDGKADALVEAFAAYKGAVHVGDRHVALLGKSTEEKATIEEAEAHLGGPFTIPGTTRATWAFGGDAADHVVQILYLADRHMGMREIVESAARRPEETMKAVKALVADGTARRFRTSGGGTVDEEYGLARAARERIDSAMRIAKV